MTDLKRDAGLRPIFSVFLGLMLTAFIGVGVYTFHPPPDAQDARLAELSRLENEIRPSRAEGPVSPADQSRLREIERERADLIDARDNARESWVRSTSMILIAFATLAMALSLVRPERAPVINAGGLLGGVFTMIYGVGWVVVADVSKVRFLVITAALGITLGLGYLRFGRKGVEAAQGAGGGSGEGLATLETRLARLEARMDAAAHALGASSPGSSHTP